MVGGIPFPSKGVRIRRDAGNVFASLGFHLSYLADSKYELSKKRGDLSICTDCKGRL
jgi:hypothetical protein